MGIDWILIWIKIIFTGLTLVPLAILARQEQGLRRVILNGLVAACCLTLIAMVAVALGLSMPNG